MKQLEITNINYLKWKYSPQSRRYGIDKCNICGNFSTSRTCWNCSLKTLCTHKETTT